MEGSSRILWDSVDFPLAPGPRMWMRVFIPFLADCDLRGLFLFLEYFQSLAECSFSRRFVPLCSEQRRISGASPLMFYPLFGRTIQGCIKLPRIQRLLILSLQPLSFRQRTLET